MHQSVGVLVMGLAVAVDMSTVLLLSNNSLCNLHLSIRKNITYLLNWNRFINRAEIECLVS